MALTFFNTLTKRKEEFVPVREGEVRLYHCGPTVYNFAHIGNLRAYVFADIVRRSLEYNGYRVKQVMNITDVGEPTSDESEDKMAKGLRREGKPLTLEAMNELGEFYTNAFVADLRTLNIKIPHEMPRASMHIAEDLELIRILLEKKIAYQTGSGIYFDISQFPAYGTRGGFALGELKAGARVGVNEEKRSPRDFALWKFSPQQSSGQASDGLPAFQSPFGPGFPGWHLECSAMSRTYLGQPFDIHTGGIDHIPTHHQNEIAQSEAAYGAPLAHYWMHSEFVNIADGNKMAKSEDNFLTLRALTEKGIHPIAYRFWLLGAHYRSPITFSFEALHSAQNELGNMNERVYRFNLPKKGAAVQEYTKQFEEIMSDDLNTPNAKALLWRIIRDENLPEEDRRETVLYLAKILGIDFDILNKELPHPVHLDREIFGKELEKKMSDEDIPPTVRNLIVLREEARQQKDFEKADKLRKKINEAGYDIEDTQHGFTLRKRYSS